MIRTQQFLMFRINVSYSYIASYEIRKLSAAIPRLIANYNFMLASYACATSHKFLLHCQLSS